MTTTPVQYHLGQFPPKTLDWSRLIPLIGTANAGLARYDGLLSAIPNAHILLSPLTTQEAVLSCGTRGYCSRSRKGKGDGPESIRFGDC